MPQKKVSLAPDTQTTRCRTLEAPHQPPPQNAEFASLPKRVQLVADLSDGFFSLAENKLMHVNHISANSPHSSNNCAMPESDDIEFEHFVREELLKNIRDPDNRAEDDSTSDDVGDVKTDKTIRPSSPVNNPPPHATVNPADLILNHAPANRMEPPSGLLVEPAQNNSSLFPATQMHGPNIAVPYPYLPLWVSSLDPNFQSTVMSGQKTQPLQAVGADVNSLYNFQFRQGTQWGIGCGPGFQGVVPYPWPHSTGNESNSSENPYLTPAPAPAPQSQEIQVDSSPNPGAASSLSSQPPSKKKLRIQVMTDEERQWDDSREQREKDERAAKRRRIAQAPILVEGFPNGDVPLPPHVWENAQLELVRNYPNHLYGDYLRLLVEAGWTARQLADQAGGGGRISRNAMGKRVAKLKALGWLKR